MDNNRIKSKKSIAPAWIYEGDMEKLPILKFNLLDKN
jgi:hypothetical protein